MFLTLQFSSSATNKTKTFPVFFWFLFICFYAFLVSSPEFYAFQWRTPGLFVQFCFLFGAQKIRNKIFKCFSFNWKSFFAFFPCRNCFRFIFACFCFFSQLSTRCDVAEMHYANRHKKQFREFLPLGAAADAAAALINLAISSRQERKLFMLLKLRKFCSSCEENMKIYKCKLKEN